MLQRSEVPAHEQKSGGGGNGEGKRGHKGMKVTGLLGDFGFSLVGTLDQNPPQKNDIKGIANAREPF